MKFSQVRSFCHSSLAIPVSGFSNIHFYVPYVMAMGNSFSDPTLRGVIICNCNISVIGSIDFGA
jgi:hypothetical protein